MVCKFCGQELPDDAVICSGCGRAINEESSSSNEIANNKGKQISKSSEKGDKISVGGFIISFIIPLVGLVYWIVKHKSAPKKAKSYGIGAIIGFFIGFITIALGGAEILL